MFFVFNERGFPTVDEGYTTEISTKPTLLNAVELLGANPRIDRTINLAREVFQRLQRLFWIVANARVIEGIQLQGSNHRQGKPTDLGQE